MATSLQQIEIDGRSIWVEVSDITAPVTSEFSNTSNTVLENASEALQSLNIADTLRTLVGPVHAALQDMKPQEITVELGLGFSVKGNLFVATGEGSANLKVSAKWKMDP